MMQLAVEPLDIVVEVKAAILGDDLAGDQHLYQIVNVQRSRDESCQMMMDACLPTKYLKSETLRIFGAALVL